MKDVTKTDLSSEAACVPLKGNKSFWDPHKSVDVTLWSFLLPILPICFEYHV
jgi:hypothetical protein